MITATETSADGTSEESIFAGEPFKCRLSFYGRGQNASAPTLVTSKTNLHKGDLFVISLNEEGTQKLVLQVDEERLAATAPPEIFIDESIKRTFSVITFMRNLHTMQKVANKEKFALYLVELQVKEQYLSRGDMWRFSRKLINTNVYLKKSLDMFGMRATVYGLWVDKAPYRVSSGYLTKNTKIVFRSLSACCTIFLQMSKEMWDFDHQGDTFYEKAVDGFLADLFTRWKLMSCQHDVTMTLFSRVFYDAKSLEDFPQRLRQHINKDYRGRFYEDFYRVIYQNERYDDWSSRLATIKKVLINYKEELLTYHKKKLPKNKADEFPRGFISGAADGNFLETLNLSSSVFERHFIDQPFDRLGQMSLVITPGTGVFEVERELTNMTKQRVLDNGIGSDLVCLGEQPLFAVPLFKFFKEDPDTADDYQIAHWMNLSYYHRSTAPSCFPSYIPRLQFDKTRIKNDTLDAKNVMNSIEEDAFSKPLHMSMEEYDEKVFRSHNKLSTKDSHADKLTNTENRKARRRNITMGSIYGQSIEEEDSCDEKSGLSILKNDNHIMPDLYDTPRPYNANIKDDLSLSTSHTGASSSSINNFQYQTTLNSSFQLLFCNSQSFNRMARSAETYFLQSNIFARIQARPKALINPFAPASIRIPMAPGRRRWAHTFPIGPNNLPWHFHHLRHTEGTTHEAMSTNVSKCAHMLLPGTSKKVTDGLVSRRPRHLVKMSSDLSLRPKRAFNCEIKRTASERKDSGNDDARSSVSGPTRKKSSSDVSTKSVNSKREKQDAIIWGPTGVEPWSASMITGIDWKSLTIPATLPTTFDVVPSADELQRDFTHNAYTLIHALPPHIEIERKKKIAPNGNLYSDKILCNDNIERQRITFDELIDQRLSQGFQMIVDIPGHIHQKMSESIRRAGYKETEYNRLLSIGRIYHTLSLVTEENQSQDTVVIYVQQHKPQNAFLPKPVEYKYRFQCPDSSDFDPASYELQLERLELFSWNLVDNVVGNHGTGDHKLSDLVKYWHTRLVLMPVSKDYTIKNIESGQTKCDSRKEMSHEDFFLYVEHFVRFLFMLNKLSHSSMGSTECIHRPLDPKTGKKRTDPTKRQGKNLIPIQTFQLANVMSGDLSAINNLLNLFQNEQQGLLFVKDSVLPEYTFIGIEAIWWSIEHGDVIEDEKTALSLFEYLFTNQYIRHCTHTENSFRFGFFLYYIVTEKTRNFRLDANDYAEVEFYQTQSYIPSMDYLGFAECKPMRLLPKLIETPQIKPRKQGSPSNGINLSSLSNTKNSKPQTPSIVLKRDCNVDVDPKHISDRREWATAHYHSFYNPHCLFELEIRWLVATSCILGDLITQWSQRTGTILGSKQVAFHLVPIPCDPFSKLDALRGPIYIKINSACLRDQLAHHSEESQARRIDIFQELILKRYGFILNACVSRKDENIYYVHISGGMLVYIISDVYNVHYNSQPTRVITSGLTVDSHSSHLDCGFYWCWNFCLGKKWRSSQTGDEKYQDIMLADFRAFCDNDNNRLVNFWNEVNNMANQKLAEKEQQSNSDD
ncbi:unnamed protein product [Rotaria magnacalcarata]|uniref:DEP domain-containing protein n=2 Tax=Rotaria magnacalcarata TaxID=392030 RepID=A0A8S2J2U5_9BILA|nr:unnamed protein product [Rotaria magnacalcarata]